MLEELVPRLKSLLAVSALVDLRSESSHIVLRYLGSSRTAMNSGLVSCLYGRLETAGMGEVGGGIWRVHLTIRFVVGFLIGSLRVVILAFPARLNNPIPGRVIGVGARSWLGSFCGDFIQV